MIEFKKEWHKDFAYIILIILFNISFPLAKNFSSIISLTTIRYLALGVFAIFFLAITIFTKVKNKNTFLESFKNDYTFRQTVLFKSTAILGIVLISVFNKN